MVWEVLVEAETIQWMSPVCMMLINGIRSWMEEWKWENEWAVAPHSRKHPAWLCPICILEFLSNINLSDLYSWLAGPDRSHQQNSWIRRWWCDMEAGSLSPRFDVKFESCCIAVLSFSMDYWEKHGHVTHCMANTHNISHNTIILFDDITSKYATNQLYSICH